MAPGPIILGDNRFAPLLEIPEKSPNPKKKKRLYPTNNVFEIFPELPSGTTSKRDPKYLTIVAADETKPLSQFSCFAIHRSLMLISKEIESISTLRDGSLLLLVKNIEIANKFIKSKDLHGLCPIKCSLHERLNITKGTIYAPYLNNVSDEKIVKELNSQGVISIYKFSRTVVGKKQFTGVILLDFNLYTLPSKIDICWHTVKIKEYLPNPMRCKSCQLLGHTIKWCKNNPSCETCNLPPHNPSECTRIMCANCYENHPSSSPQCKTFKMQKEILAIKTRKKCTMGQAKKIYSSLYSANTTNSVTYASVITSPNITTTSSRNETLTSKLNSNTSIINNTNSLTTKETKKTNNNVTSNQSTTPAKQLSIELNNNNILSSKNITNQQNVTVNNSYDINESNIITNNNNKKNNINLSNSNDITSLKATNTINNKSITEPYNDNVTPQYSKSTYNPPSRSPSPNNLFSPPPSLKKVLSTQNLDTTDDEMST